MPEVVVVRGSGGAIFEMDVPTRAHAAELFAERIASGELVIVTDPVEWVEVPGGGRKLMLALGVPAEVPSVASDAPRRGRPPKVRESAESAVEAAPVEGE
jgi:hypothetical protein